MIPGVDRPLLVPVLVAVLASTLATSPTLGAAAPPADASHVQGPDAGAAPPALPACVQVSSDARWVPYGYNHVVVIKNGCSRAATCAVSTDVNPQPSSVDVAAGATSEVVTFSASPSQAFTAKVTCRLR